MKGETAKSGFQAVWQFPRQFSARNTLLRTLRLSATAVGIILALAGIARAGDDDDEQPQSSFEQGIVKNLIEGLAGQNMDDSKIEYRERSPLVVPKSNNLPPPAPKKTKFGGNWPKDPDEQARREAIAAAKEGPVDPREAARPVMPSELAIRKPKSKDDTSPQSAVPYVNQILNPSQLGYNGGLFSGMFGSKEEKTKFKEEPKREALTQPPVGYQTPSPNYSYGTGGSSAKTPEVYNPITDKGTVQR
ncbi:MAG: hypothetical protein EKK40_17875 [Bradyrhizobiaceae bacterium]|nr:MAG: hypothetical protein EKK40_17875 [Bradyrhizobiaceae bacterium]